MARVFARAPPQNLLALVLAVAQAPRFFHLESFLANRAKHARGGSSLLRRVGGALPLFLGCCGCFQQQPLRGTPRSRACEKGIPGFGWSRACSRAATEMEMCERQITERSCLCRLPRGGSAGSFFCQTVSSLAEPAFGLARFALAGKSYFLFKRPRIWSLSVSKK